MICFLLNAFNYPEASVIQFVWETEMLAISVTNLLMRQVSAYLYQYIKEQFTSCLEREGQAGFS